jgi:hypothetical protein
MYDPKYAAIGFPKAVQLSTGRIAWWSDELEAWVDSRPEVLALSLPDEEQDDLGVDEDIIPPRPKPYLVKS